MSPDKNSEKPVEKPGEAEARLISRQGWLQGAIFLPTEEELSVPVPLDRDRERLMICSQSCTVVSKRFDADPKVEAMVITPLNRYNPRHTNATGKNARKLHVQLDPGGRFEAVECDINRRFFFDRKKLIDLAPSADAAISSEEAVKLAAWIGRYYTRIAFPDAVVDKMVVSLNPLLGQVFEEDCGDGPFHGHIPFIYVRWDPEVDRAENYSIDFFLLCDDADIGEALDQRLIETLEPFSNEPGKDGLVVSHIVRTPDTTFVSDLRGYQRLSEWDSFSKLGDIVQHPPVE